MLTSGFLLQNRYRIVQPFGSGGQGAVYLALHLGLNTYVAIKEGFSNDPAANAQFQSEANLLAHLSHPNLPRVTDFFVEPNGARYLVMEYVQGENLEKIVQQRGAPIPESEALNWFRQIFDAVKYLHANRVIHRDIKPQNIIITPNGRAVLVDFGIAKVMASSALTGASMRFGSPGFAPPEQYSGGTDERSDIYSLGGTLYFALTGQTPPEAPLRASGVKVTPPRQINGAISVNVERAILKAMSLDAAMRYASVWDMERTIFRKQNAILLGTRVINPPLWLFGVIVLAILLLLGLLGWTGMKALGGNRTATVQIVANMPSLTPTFPSTATSYAKTDIPTKTVTRMLYSTSTLKATFTKTSTFTVTPSRTPSTTSTPKPIITKTSVPTAQPTLIGSGVVRGQVRWNDQPLPNISIELFTDVNSGCGGRPVARATTDSAGNYQFTKVLAGKYGIGINGYFNAPKNPLFDSIGTFCDPFDLEDGGTFRADEDLAKNDLVVVSPAKDSTVSQVPIFTWQPYQGAKSYRVDVYGPPSEAPSGQSAKWYLERSQTTTHVEVAWFEKLEVGRKYYGYVNAFNGNGTRIAEGYFNFTVSGQ